MHLGRNAEVLIEGPVAKLELKKFLLGIIGDGCQGGGFHDDRFQGWDLILDSCGFLLRFRSPRAAAISFQRAMVVLSPTAGAIASINR